MYYRKRDSRMGDEIFSMAFLIAPFAWKIVKSVEAKVNAKVLEKKAKFQALPLKEQARKKSKMCFIAEIVLICMTVLRVITGISALFKGQFSSSDITSILGCVVVIVILEVGKKKYENDAKTTIE